jgi:hypothetical protein
MNQPMRFLRLLLAWLIAAAVTGVIGSLIQTQSGLAAISALGAPVPAGVRLLTTLQDLAGFAPMLALLSAGGFLPAFLVAALLLRWWPGQRTLLYGLAGAAAMATILLLMDATLPITAIGAARSLPGAAALVLAGAAGGLAFARLAPARLPARMA